MANYLSSNIPKQITSTPQLEKSVDQHAWFTSKTRICCCFGCWYPVPFTTSVLLASVQFPLLSVALSFNWYNIELNKKYIYALLTQL